MEVSEEALNFAKIVIEEFGDPYQNDIIESKA